METNIEKLGKVRITVDDNPWNINKAYDRLVFVKVEETGGVYMSKRPVPTNTSIHNRYYWLKFGKEANVNPDAIGEQVVDEYASLQRAPRNYTKGTIFYIDNHGESETGIITYYVALENGLEDDSLLDTNKFESTNIAAQAINIKVDRLHVISRSGNYNDLNDKPLNVSSFANDNKYISAKNWQVLTDTEKALARTNIGAIDSNYIQTALLTYINNVTYDSVNKRINFYHTAGQNNSLIAYLDATAFIKDGMVSNVSISNNKLIITFNTDAGLAPIEINLHDIFNPNNYYTKTDCDNKFLTITLFNNNIANYYNKTQIDNTFTQERNYNNNKFTEKATNINIEPDVNDNVTILELKSNTNYLINSSISTLVIDSIESALLNNDYVTTIMFTTHNSSTFTLRIPNTIKWIDGEIPDFELNSNYVFAIWKNIGVVKKCEIAS